LPVDPDPKFNLEIWGNAFDTAKEAFGVLWDSIYAENGYGWNVNPWVWIVEFEVITKKG